jgi:hypothetical protein
MQTKSRCAWSASTQGSVSCRKVDFGSDDPAFSGTMRMTRTLEPGDGGTLVTVRAESVPEGIRPEDHQAGLRSSLANLARFTEAR